MAIEAYVPLSAAAGYRKRPTDNHGKQRSIYTKFVVAVQGDINSTFALGELPPGAVRIIHPMSFIKCSAGGAGLLLDIGWAAYRYKQDVAALNDGQEAAVANGLVNDLSLVTAQRQAWHASEIKFDFYSVAGVRVIGTAVGAVVPVAFTLESLLTYVYE